MLTVKKEDWGYYNTTIWEKLKIIFGTYTCCQQIDFLK